MSKIQRHLSVSRACGQLMAPTELIFLHSVISLESLDVIFCLHNIKVLTVEANRSFYKHVIGLFAPFFSLAFFTPAFLTAFVPRITVSQISVLHFQRPHIGFFCPGERLHQFGIFLSLFVFEFGAGAGQTSKRTSKTNGRAKPIMRPIRTAA